MTALSFAMGKFDAAIPTDRLYSQHHLWLQPVGEGSGKFRTGLTAYSVRLLQDVYFLDWHSMPPLEVRRRDEIGEVESSKAMSSLYAPAAGTIEAFNDELMQSPELINTDSYGRGWLFEMTTDDDLLTPEQYVKLLHEVWGDTQRTLQGQVNA